MVHFQINCQLVTLKMSSLDVSGGLVGISKHLSRMSDVIRGSLEMFGIQANGVVVFRELLIATYMYAAQGEGETARVRT